MARLFRFRHDWHVAAPAERVAGALADLGAYPQWWPQVRSVTRRDDATAHVRVRSLLPYLLDLVLVREEADPEAGRLRVAVTGDLVGRVAFDVAPTPGGSRARLTQEVIVADPLLAPVAGPLAPLLRANHAWMVRSGRRGLARRLERGRCPDRAPGRPSYDRSMSLSLKPAHEVQTAPIAALGLVGGYLAARETQIRSLGGVVLGLAGVYAGRTWLARRGPGVAGGLAAIYLAGFGASHPLAKKIGPWPSVLGVAAASALASHYASDAAPRR